LIERLRLAGAALEIKNRELSALSSHQQNLREEEQKRIAREVHDELGQALTGLKMNIHLLKKQAAKVPAGDNLIASGLNELMEMTDSTILTVRRIASELRPSLLDDFGLVPAVEWQAQEFQRRTSIACEFTTTDESIDLGPEKNSAIYRIVQEALTNVARHANASRVAVAILTGNDEVNVTISDNGVGIMGSAALKPSFGLIGMQERSRMIGGELGIGRHPLAGTSVSLKIPLDRDPNRNGSAK
jgi:signal transduction histidine kinase